MVKIGCKLNKGEYHGLCERKNLLTLQDIGFLTAYEHMQYICDLSPSLFIFPCLLSLSAYRSLCLSLGLLVSIQGQLLRC